MSQKKCFKQISYLEAYVYCKSNCTYVVQIGEYARKNDTKISIIAIEGEEKEMSHISKAAEITSGSVNVLHPLELSRQVNVIDSIIKNV